MHGDHVGGLMVGDQMAFPNATIRADQHDADHWLSQTNMDKAPAGRKAVSRAMVFQMTYYVKAGKFKTFDGDTERVPSVKAIAAVVTPGHSIYMAIKAKMIFWGDLMHVAAVQLKIRYHDWLRYSDNKTRKAQRKKACRSPRKKAI